MDPEKRRFVRKRTDQLLYAEFGPDNGSILLNLSEEGCSFQSVAPVRDEHLRFSVSIGDGRKLEGDGHMVWSDTVRKTGGVHFLNPSKELREQVREWLEETLVTADGKLDHDAVRSKAKRRRRKLREEARLAADLASKEGALKTGKDSSTGHTGGQTPTMQTPEMGSRHMVSFNSADEISRLGYGNSSGTFRTVAAILLISALFVALITFRRELGHLVMSFGSSIAGEEQQSPPSEPASVREEKRTALDPKAKSVALSDQPNAAESSDEAAPERSEQVSQSVEEQAPPTKRSNSQKGIAVDDVSALWNSVENGDTHAEVALADRYVRGEGVPQSCAQARVLLEAAVKRGSAEAKQRVDDLAQAGCR
jgi:hypothetical protein